MRVDKYLADIMPDISRSYIQKLLSLTFNVGEGEKKETLHPRNSTSAMWECCMGGLHIQNSETILNL